MPCFEFRSQRLRAGSTNLNQIQLKQASKFRSQETISGRGQLSLVEHALCPLDAKSSLRSNLTHQAVYSFYDRNGHRKKAIARIDAPNGLSANDEFYLWGLLALAFREKEPSLEFRATPNFFLRQLGARHKPGGKDFRLFRGALRRLAAVNYQSKNFYDPIRGERCDVSFGFFSYRLPIQNESNRAWRIAWNPIFFEFCKASGGSLEFDLDVYQQLDQASRRLFLLLRKIFWRRSESPGFDLRDLAINVLGYSKSLETKTLKQRIQQCAGKLAALGIIEDSEWVTRESKGVFRVAFRKGQHFEYMGSTRRAARDARESRFFDPLSSIGFEDAAIARIARIYKNHLIDEWADITLAAMERNGRGFFKVSPQAYFMDNIKAAAAGTRGVPDWWHELRRDEVRKNASSDRHKRNSQSKQEQNDARMAFASFLKNEGRETFESLVTTIFGDLTASGVDRQDARRMARTSALDHMKKQFVGKQVPGTNVWQLLP